MTAIKRHKRKKLFCIFHEGEQSLAHNEIIRSKTIKRIGVCIDCLEELYLKMVETRVVSFDTEAVKTKDINPKSINAFLDQRIIGQRAAKKKLAVAFYNHLLRTSSTTERWPKMPRYKKSNILLVGPTGCGKTLLASTVAKMMGLPFVHADANTLTQAGYVGGDVRGLIMELFKKSNYDLSLAERGIIFIDEIDKIGRKTKSSIIDRDVSGEGVQQALLRMLEGDVIDVPNIHRKKDGGSPTLPLNTRGILFICGGAFDGLDKIVKARLDQNSIGFHSDLTLKSDFGGINILKHLSFEDLVSFGMIPEFVGRVSTIATLDALDASDLVGILAGIECSILEEYQDIFLASGCQLFVSDDALREIAKISLEHKIGARGLKTTMEELLEGEMYDLPTEEGLVAVTIEKDVVLGRKKPKRIYEKKGSSAITVAHVA